VQLPAATTEIATDVAPSTTETVPQPVQQVQQVAASAVTDVAAGNSTDSTAQLVQAAVVADTGDVKVDTDDDDTKVTLAAAVVETDATDAAPDDVPVVARATPGHSGHDPASGLPAQVSAQALAKASERAADSSAGDTAVPKVELPTQASPIAAAARSAEQGMASARVREALTGAHTQERIDHIAEQLATRLRLSQAAGGSHVQLSLKPRELGEVTVQMNVREGVVAATILVDKEDTLKTLTTNIEDLKRSLEDQGLSIQQFSVDVRGEAGAGGANARMAAELRRGASRTSAGSTSSIAGAAAVTPGLTGSRVIDADAVHEGDVSLLA
jgi:flagellar hook-length control protein FliK